MLLPSAPTGRGCPAERRSQWIVRCSARRCTSASRAHPRHPRGARGSGRAAVARRSWPRARSPRTAWRRRSPRGSARRARLLRCHRADRRRPIRSTTQRSTRFPATARASGDEYLNAPMDAPGLRSVHRRARRRRPVSAATTSMRCRTSRAACRSRRWPAGPGNAALRADEAGGPARSAHRPRAARRGAAPPRGPGRTDVEPGRLPDPAPESGAAARVPDDPGPRRGRVLPLRQHPPERVPEQPRHPRPRPHRAGRRPPLFAGQLTGVEGYTDRSAPASSRASTWPAASRTSPLSFHRRPPCSAGSTATSATPTRDTSSR